MESCIANIGEVSNHMFTSYNSLSGLVGGDVHLREYNFAESVFSSEVVKVSHKHHDVVRRLAFRPMFSGNTEGIYLASCSNDNRVQLFKVSI